MAQDVLEKLIEEEENIPVRGMRAKLPVFDDYADIPKEEIEDIIKKEIEYIKEIDPNRSEKEIKEELTKASWFQQKIARKRFLNKILQRDPDYFKKRERQRERYKEFKKNFFNSELSCVISNNDSVSNIIDSFLNFCESYCKLNEENATLKEITNDDLFASKNKEIKELQERNKKLEGKINKMFTSEEVQKIMEDFVKHIQNNNDNVHKPVCEVYCDSLGLVKNVECSCGQKIYTNYI